MKPIVAVVGRPNVGKSTLFNKIAGQRIAIVEDTPGITRDRIYADAEWNGREFTLIDTGGIEPSGGDVILSQMREQASLAIDMADVILFMVNVRDGMTAADSEVAAMLQKCGKPVLLVCNKVDNPGSPPMAMYEFYNLGMGDPYPVSSTHGLGLGDLLDEVVAYFPPAQTEEDEEDVIRVAVVGKPNAGKSSLVNRILGENRVIVSEVAGTTRDAIDSVYEKDGQKYVFIDTAGMRKRGKIDENVERYSVVRALSAVDRADVCLIMIDAQQGITEQDSKIAGYVHEQGKAAIVVVNKWDLVEKETNTMKNFRNHVKEGLNFMMYAPSVYISALTGQRVDSLFEMIHQVREQNRRRISTGVLNDVINEAIAMVQPPSDKGKRLKIYYATQAGVCPPTFVLFVNQADLAHYSYVRYLENQLRGKFGFEGTPIKFIVREKKRDR
ncbi:ribosome biogenesis GTPase Der [Ructibacterium gallinarum]|uniref:GTPase Der n=1 Tax=Ructibacterium gallinarum TaxID=2779355 RepID=A0A9D5R8X8_9FIRM|nr:ribosome biogenesis GTPase Der [Ructibacterium gallinarum]MBE5040437.1 ribosome biogenesis GTPase Der [Ructibacterium gallinarum]